MNNWHKVTLSKKDIIAGVKQNIMTEFLRLWIAVSAPSKAAIFNPSLFDDLDSGDFTLYFTPACSQVCPHLIAAHSGIPCEEPEDIELLVGDSAALD